MNIPAKAHKSDGKNSSDILNCLIYTYSCKNILEIGVYNGECLFGLLENKNNINYIGIDLWADDIIFNDGMGYSNISIDSIKNNLKNLSYTENKLNVFVNLEKQNKVTLIQDNSKSLIKNNLEKQDLIFIDASHSYDEVKLDIDNSIKILSNKSIICGHDYHQFPDVKKAVLEIFGEPKELENFNLIKENELYIIPSFDIWLVKYDY